MNCHPTRYSRYPASLSSSDCWQICVWTHRTQFCGNAHWIREFTQSRNKENPERSTIQNNRDTFTRIKKLFTTKIIHQETSAWTGNIENIFMVPKSQYFFVTLWITDTESDWTYQLPPTTDPLKKSCTDTLNIVYTRRNRQVDLAL